MSTGAPPTERRVLGAFDGTLVTVGAMVGSGIFSTPSLVARAVHRLDLALAVWLAGAGLSLLGAFVIAEPGAALPERGGLTAILRRAFGPRASFAFGWTMTLVLVPSSVAFFAGVTAEHLGAVIPWSVPTLTSLVIVAVGAVNLLGLQPAARLQSAVTLVRVVALAAVALAALWLPPAVPVSAAPVAAVSWTALLAAMVPVLWAYDGWIDLTSLAAEVRSPGRTIPRALIAGVALVTALYLLVVVAFHRALSTAVLSTAAAPAALLGSRLSGVAGERVMVALVALSTFGGCLIGLVSGTRVVAALGDDAPPLRALAGVDRRGVPAAATVLTVGLALAYARVEVFGKMAEVFVVGAWPFYALGAWAALRLRRREPGLARPFHTPGSPWTVWAFLAVTVAMLGSFARESPRPTLLSLGVVALGMIAYRAPREG
ncbi:MAG: amino acid permease [Myxococcaceae bacterium]|nr:MAG: amino acid permease [Myxococcaceae bacterium]